MTPHLAAATMAPTRDEFRRQFFIAVGGGLEIGMHRHAFGDTQERERPQPLRPARR